MIAKTFPNPGRPCLPPHMLKAGSNRISCSPLNGSVHAIAALELVEICSLSALASVVAPAGNHSHDVLPTQRLAGHEALQAALTRWKCG